MSVRLLLAPFLHTIFARTIPFVAKRIKFENKNLSDNRSISFKKSAKVAPVLFSISSEGEFDQVKSLLDLFINRGDCIEIIYTSHSVEKKVQNFADLHRGKVATLRLPLLSFFPFKRGKDIFKWATAKSVIFCRYEFYPELILLPRIRKGKAILVNATVKSKKNSLYLDLLYSYFDIIIAATRGDAERLSKINSNLMTTFDFRFLTIFKRIDERFENYSKNPVIPLMLEFLKENYPYRNRLVIGSAWPIEMQIFNDSDFTKAIKGGQFITAVFPHKLDSAEVLKIQNSINKEIPVYLIDKTTTVSEWREVCHKMKSMPGVLVVALSGHLCELYREFGHAYIGGGHGRSIHSVLEPFLAESIVYCGPKIHRSTEFDLINDYSPRHINLINELPSLYQRILENRDLPLLAPLISKIRIESEENSSMIEEKLLSFI